MKVICIDASNQRNDGTPNVVENEIYTVAGRSPGGRGYILCELFNPLGYKEYRFIPISDIDETETEVYKNLQTQTV